MSLSIREWQKLEIEALKNYLDFFLYVVPTLSLWRKQDIRFIYEAPGLKAARFLDLLYWRRWELRLDARAFEAILFRPHGEPL